MSMVQEESYERVKEDSGEMPASVPNFLVKTYEIVNVSCIFEIQPANLI